ncbi:hypothetical protein [Dactylosporangium sp. NPDC048998]|uniref:hypothetical protein n=1 Tax=Dactylosporangium sp. NPDC048998 TaxID=3363976 RepID=UPI00371C0BEB
MDAGRFDDDLQPWSAGQQEGYDRAIGVLRALAAAYSARIARPEARDDVAQLRAERGKVAAQQRDLDPADHTAIARILAEYPAVLREVRSGPP